MILILARSRSLIFYMILGIILISTFARAVREVLRMILVGNTRRVRSDRVAIHAWNIHLKRHRFVNQTSTKSVCVTLSGSFSPITQERTYLNFIFSLYFCLHLILYIIGTEIERATCFS